MPIDEQTQRRYPICQRPLYQHKTYFLGHRNSYPTFMNPATAAAPHLSRDMPAITPPALMSAPPVSYVTPLPTSSRVSATGPAGTYVRYMMRPRCLSITATHMCEWNHLSEVDRSSFILFYLLTFIL